ncbi:MAG: Ca2+-dependent phosphoinositide-specific phospholipase C [Acidimicrobiales bacterium]
MQEPGIKVLHIQDVDYRSTCLTFVACLQQIEGWSDANPSHLPIAVLVELKDDPLSFGDFTFTTPEPWTAAGMDELDDDIRSVMGPDDLITPDDVRGGHPTLEDAVLTDGWPTLGESRGKVLFMMDNGGGYRSAYLAGHPSLEGRILFTNANPGDADAAFVKRNDPFDASIPDLVQAGYLVRTRADADTVEAREEDTGPRDAALASGAQFVSTDYPVPGIAVGFTTSYVAEIPGGTVARCNPLIGPETCVDAELDTIYAPVAPPTTSTTSTTTSPPTTAPPGSTAPPVAPGAQPVRGDARYTG